MTSKKEKVVDSVKWLDLKPGDLIVKFDKDVQDKPKLVLFVSFVDDPLGISDWIKITYLNELGEVKSNFYKAFFKIKENGWKLVAWLYC